MLNSSFLEAVSQAGRESVGVLVSNAALFLLNFRLLIHPKYRKIEYQAESYVYMGDLMGLRQMSFAYDLNSTFLFSRLCL